MAELIEDLVSPILKLVALGIACNPSLTLAIAEVLIGLEADLPGRRRDQIIKLLFEIRKGPSGLFALTLLGKQALAL
jgi:hypothetical protein